MSDQQHIIKLDQDGTLCELLRERVGSTPAAVAYRQYEEAAGDWVPWTWQQFADTVSRWQQALAQEALQAGDRIALMLKNCREWAAFDMAAQGLGLVVVPLYVNDRADNLGLILQDCGAKLLLVGDDEQWQTLAPVEETLAGLQRILSLEPAAALPEGLAPMPVDDWLTEADGERLEKMLVQRIAAKLKDSPVYTKIPRVAVIDQPWTVESGMMTPTLKLKREKILDAHGADVDRLYAGH